MEIKVKVDTVMGMEELSTSEQQLLDLAKIGGAESLQQIKNLIKAGVYLDVQDKDGNTPLMLAAATKNHEAVVQMLLQTKKVYFDMQNNDGRTALMLASIAGNDLAVALLITVEATVTMQDHNKRTALFYAAQGGHVNCIKMLLKKDHKPVNLADHDGLTPLMIALDNGHKGAAIELLPRVADFNQADKNGNTALMLAVILDDKPLVAALLHYKMDVFLKNKQGETAHDLATDIFLKHKLEQPECDLAAATNNNEIVQLLHAYNKQNIELAEQKRLKALSAQFAESRKQKELEADFVLAALNNRIDKLETLLKQKVNVNATHDYEKMTALMWAAQKGYLDMVKRLLEVKNIEVNKKNAYGFTALALTQKYFLGIDENKEPIIKLLLQAGADSSEPRQSAGAAPVPAKPQQNSNTSLF